MQGNWTDSDSFKAWQTYYTNGDSDSFKARQTYYANGFDVWVKLHFPAEAGMHNIVFQFKFTDQSDASISWEK